MEEHWIEGLVRAAVERIAEIAPLSPMAKLEIDAVLGALCESVVASAAAECDAVAEDYPADIWPDGESSGAGARMAARRCAAAVHELTKGHDCE